MLLGLFVKIFFGLVILFIIAVFPGLDFMEWLRGKFKEADGEPIVWK